VVNDARRQGVILKQAGAMTEEAALSRIRAERSLQDEQARTKKAEIDAQIDAERKIRNFGALLADTLTPIFNKIIGPLTTMLVNHLPTIGKAINEFVTDLIDPTKREKLFDKMMGKLVDLLSDLFVLTFAALGKKLIPDQAKVQEMFFDSLKRISPGIGMAGMLTQMYTGPNTTAQPQSPLTNQPPSRSLGSFGATGNAFENFGSGTPIIAHDIEGVFKPEHITQLLRAGTSNALEGLVSQLNNTQAEMNRTLREIADYGRRNVDATNSLSGNAFA
jgi:hypothetical protein